jgi:transketolase
MVKFESLKKKLPENTRKMRVRIAGLIRQAGASHIGSCFSLMEMLDAVYQSVDRDKIKRGVEDRDRIIISKGHSAAAVYAVLTQYGLMENEILESYGINGSLLSGHVNHFVRFIEHSTGALGHGLPVSVGICLGMRSRKLETSRCYVLVGDGELQEGSNWEALMMAGHLNLNHLCVLVDNNGFGGVRETSQTCCLSPLKMKFESFGFDSLEVDGHNQSEILNAIAQFKQSRKPFAIICNTIKGKGASFMEGQNVWHYRPPTDIDCKNLENELLGEPE